MRGLLDFLAAAKAAAPLDEDGGRDWLALIVAVYGAFVASCVAIYQFRRDRPGVKVRLAAVASSESGGRLVERWAVRIINHRQRPITIDNAGVLVNDGQQLQAPFVNSHGNQPKMWRHPFPLTLTDGQSARVFINVIIGGEDVTGAWARDALGREYKTRRSLRQRWRLWRLNRRLKRSFRSGGKRRKS